MRLVDIILVALAGFALASFLALYSYGRFAERAHGKPSFSLPVSEQGTPLDGLVAPLVAERPEQSGLMLVDGNLDAFAARALAARGAGRSLDLQYYIWQDDLTGRLLAREIVEAADRGVRVRLLLDDINAGIRQDLSDARCSPEHRRPPVQPEPEPRGCASSRRRDAAPSRQHHEAHAQQGMDRRRPAGGGRGPQYRRRLFRCRLDRQFPRPRPARAGDAVRQTEVVFDDYWNSNAVISISALGKARVDDLPELRKEMAGFIATDQARPYPDRVAEDETVREMLSGKGHIHWTADARVVSDPSEKVKGAGQENWLMNAIRPLLASATDNLEIISPYFIPGEAGTRQFVAMAGQGARVSVLTNSLAATDVIAVHGAYAHYREPLIEGGVRPFELKPYDDQSDLSLCGSSSASLHTKAFTVDGRQGFIGSMNFDPRSISLNSKMGVVFEHAGLVGQVREVFADETSPQKSYRVRIDDGEIIWQDGPAEAARTLREEPEAGIWHRLTAMAIGLLPIESQL